MSNLSARIATRKMPHKDVPICLDLDLLAQRETAMRAISTTRKGVDDQRLVSREISPATRALEEIEQQIRDSSITIRIIGVDRTTYNQWLLACPPRKGKQEQFDPKFFMHAAKHSAVYVDEHGAEHEISDDEWNEIDKMLTDGEHDRISEAVVYVNRAVGAVDVGFFGNGSGMTRDSSETSDSRGTSASPRAASGAGSRRKSTSKTSTKKAGAA